MNSVRRVSVRYIDGAGTAIEIRGIREREEGTGCRIVAQSATVHVWQMFRSIILNFQIGMSFPKIYRANTSWCQCNIFMDMGCNGICTKMRCENLSLRIQALDQCSMFQFIYVHKHKYKYPVFLNNFGFFHRCKISSDHENPGYSIVILIPIRYGIMFLVKQP